MLEMEQQDKWVADRCTILIKVPIQPATVVKTSASKILQLHVDVAWEGSEPILRGLHDDNFVIFWAGMERYKLTFSWGMAETVQKVPCQAIGIAVELSPEETGQSVLSGDTTRATSVAAASQTSAGGVSGLSTQIASLTRSFIESSPNL